MYFVHTCRHFGTTLKTVSYSHCLVKYHVTGHFRPQNMHGTPGTECQSVLRHVGHWDTAIHYRNYSLSYKL